MLRQCGSLSCVSTLFLGCMIGASVLLIHSMLLVERQRIETLENQILAQQKQWNDAWIHARQEDLERFADESAKIRNDIAHLQVKQQEAVPMAAISEQPVLKEDQEKKPEDVDVASILRENFAQHPSEGLAPDYHDSSMDNANDNLQIEAAGAVSSPMVVDHNPSIERRRIARRSLPKSQHLPKFIIMGVKKCGTSALSRYLKIHPDFAAAGETYFFANAFKKGIGHYQSLMPNSTDDQITYEKTPNYYRLPVVPDRIRNFNRTIKLIYVTCDPVRRTLSDFFHIHRYDEEPPKEGDLEAALSDRLSAMETDFATIRENHPDDWFDEVYRMYKDRTNWFNYTDSKSNLIINGAYAIYYKRWLENFDPSQLLVVDGTDMLTNPAKWTLQVQDFVGVERLIDERNFIFDEERGFYCFMRQGDHTKYCLSGGKGRTNSKTMSESFRLRLYNFFTPFTRKFADDLHLNLTWEWNPNK